MKYAFIREHLAQSFPVQFCCEVLGVCTSGYYDAKARPVSPRQLRRQNLAQQVHHVHQENHSIYGSPRITHALRRRGVSVCRNTVARIMQETGLRSRRCRRFRPRTTDSSRTLMPAPNLLRELTPPTGPDQIWVADITYIPIQGGYVYLAGIMDLYSRKIVGWHLGNSLETSLTERALRTAVATRRPAAGLVHHSDRGIQYDSLRYRHLLKEHGLIQSMSRKGDCYDNAAMESFWATLKTELVGDFVYRDIDHALNHIFRFIEGFYPNQRLHSSLNYATPAEVERVII